MTVATDRSAGEAARAWADALAAWAIPHEIVDAAPESPWTFSPTLFALAATRAVADAANSASCKRAAEALPVGGSVLDIGVGGGAASLPLAPPAGLLTGVDQGEEMLTVFAAAAERRAVAHREVHGSWPEVAALVEEADVVVCHNVAYNVADLVPFAAALTAHARYRVVLELTAEHPTSNLNPIFLALHGIVRPTSPTADDAVAVLAEMGLDVHHESFERRWTLPGATRADTVAFARRRLCLGPERDPEIDALLWPAGQVPVRRVVTVWWDPPG